MAILTLRMLRRGAQACYKNGAWMNFLPPLACIIYTAVTIGCLSIPASNLVSMLSPNGDELRFGYFGICVKTAKETGGKWRCAAAHKLDHPRHMHAVVQAIMALQHNAVYPLPAACAILLLILWLLNIVIEKRSRYVFRWVVRLLLWISCVIGFGGALMSLVLGRAMVFAAPVFESKVRVGTNLANVVLTWIAFALHVGYVAVLTWWDRR